MSSLRCTYSGGGDYHYFKGGEALNVHSLYVHGLTDTNYFTIILLSGPIVSVILERVNHRLVAMTGGLMSGLGLIASAFITNTAILGVSLAMSGKILSSLLNYPSGTKNLAYFETQNLTLGRPTVYVLGFGMTVANWTGWYFGNSGPHHSVYHKGGWG